MKVAIIDDEPQNRIVIRRIIEQNCPHLDIVVDEGSIEKSIEAISERKPDLVFLDIRLKNGTGFDILERLGYKPRIIFTTAYSEYAMKAFKVQAVDYILKPIDEQEFIASVAKAEKLILARQTTPPNSYSYTEDQTTRTISYDEIWYFEQKDGHARLVTEQGNSYLLSDLDTIEKELASQRFYRTHPHYIVNLKKIKSIDVKKEGKINLANDTVIPVAPSRLSDFLQLIRHIHIS